MIMAKINRHENVKKLWTLLLTSCLLGSASFVTAQEIPFLSCRRVEEGRLADKTIRIPGELAQVHVYEGAPRSVHVGGKVIAVDYGKSGCLFNRADGKLKRRFTVADGWPRIRPEVFGSPQPPGQRNELVGSGVLYRFRSWGEETPNAEAVAEVTFQGKQWRALQPAKFLDSLNKGRVNRRERCAECVDGTIEGAMRAGMQAYSA